MDLGQLYTLQNNLEKDDHVVMMLPNYMQIWGIAEAMGCKVDGFQSTRKQLETQLSSIKKVVTPKTKMIVICNPNNLQAMY